MNWDTYNSAEAHGTSTGATEDMFTQNIEIEVEITAVDERMVEHSFTGTHVANDKVGYTFNRYGQLNMTVGIYKAKGSLAKGILNAISVGRKYFTPTEELGVANQWTLTKGILFPNGSKLRVGILSRGDRVIGIYKAGTNVASTIEWYEKMVYKGEAWKNMRVHSLRTFKPEWHVEDDIYATQEPEFTREAELEEIAQFISSLRGRRLSADEQILLEDIKAELNTMM